VTKEHTRATTNLDPVELPEAGSSQRRRGAASVDLLDLLSPSRRRVVQAMKRHGEVTIDEFVDELGLATTTVRQHLAKLHEAGLVEYRTASSGPGRPYHGYRLTPAAGHMFPSKSGELFGRLLGFMTQGGSTHIVEAFFEEIWREHREVMLDRLRLAATLEERLEVVRGFLAEEGFAPEIELDERGVTIHECNCPLFEAVRATRLPCRLEAELLEHALQQELDRASYMPEGHPTCSYFFSFGPDVRPSTAAATTTSEVPAGRDSSVHEGARFGRPGLLAEETS